MIAISRTAKLLAASAALAGLLTGCGSATDGPARTIERYYSHVSEAEFVKACELIDPDVRQVFSRVGGTCETALAGQYSTDDRARMTDTRVDPEKITVDGDTATVPSEAVTMNGQASSNDDDIKLVKRDGDWLIAFS